MEEKQTLIEKIVRQPLDFSDEEFLTLVKLGTEDGHEQKEAELNFDDLRKMIIRIFDINETTLKQQSDATTGVLGFLNRKSTGKRRKRYYKLIDQGFRSFDNTNKKLIVAEGDSWFQFPFFVRDIIDWLSDEPNYAVYSIAYGGDWFTNILYDEKYIEELSIHRPDVFLISGGGNDFVGANRLAAMVMKGDCKRPNSTPFYNEFFGREKKAIQEQIQHGYQFILPSFYSFLWTIKAQYWKLFYRLQKSGKYPDMKIITQGYDYVIPSFKINTKKWYALQPLVNKMAGTGGWLKRPLMIQGIQKDYDSRCIMKALIFEINLLFSHLATNFGFDNVYHIDCRGTAQTDEDWWDEIHLHSEGFAKIARAYKHCINNRLTEKVIRVTDWETKDYKQPEAGLAPLPA